MINRILGIDPQSLVTVEAFHFQQTSLALLAVLIVVALAYAAILYWRETRLSLRTRIILATCRLLAAGVLIAVLFEPMLNLAVTTNLRPNIVVLTDVSESMAIRDTRKSPDQLAEAAMVLGKMSLGRLDAAAITERLKTEVGSVSRLEIEKGLLGHPDLGLLGPEGSEYVVRRLRFAGAVAPMSDLEEPAGAAGAAEVQTRSTELGTAIQKSVDLYGGQPIAGVIVLTDGASNAGLDPLAVAAQMKERGIPIYPVGIGLPAGDDVRLRSVAVQEVAFAKDMVPVRAQIVSNGFENRAAELTVVLDDLPVARKTIVLTGGTQFEELSFQASLDPGTRKLQVAVSPLPGEAMADNNRLEQPIRIVDEKIKVLYIEGSPRWEYRYLRAILKRDARIDAHFINTEGDRDLTRASKEYIARFPEDPEEAFKYDLVILGDVRRDVFNSAQLDRMAELVRDHGGSFILLAGHKHAPAEYADTPVGAMLPVVAEEGKWHDLSKDVFPALTAEGLQNMVMSLEASESENQKLWAKVKPLVSVAPLAGPKPGARMLAELWNWTDRGRPYPLIAWQRFGSGKVLYVGTDRLWQLRAGTGDKYHTRFWGQAVQFLTLSRLLGENKRIRLDTDRATIGAGEPIQVFANVLNEAYEPVVAMAYRVAVQGLKDSGEADGQAETVQLGPVAGHPGLYHGLFVPRAPRRFRLGATGEDRAAANTVEFQAVSATVEQLETSMQEGLLRKMAEMSGGRYFSIPDLPELAATIRGSVHQTTIRKPVPLWDSWLVPVLFLGLAGLEWAWRRKNDLA